MAHFEVFVLNYNGAHYLNECLTALSQIEVSSHKVVINVVDNASSDKSEEFVRDNFPDINYLALNHNLGFSGGNNLGFKLRQSALKSQNIKADYAVFLNNDTAVDKNWLISVADVFNDSKVGIVGSKSVFYDQYIVLEINTDKPFSPKDFGSTDTRVLGVRMSEPVYGENILSETGRTKSFGSHLPEGDKRWLTSASKFYIPVKNSSVDTELNFLLENLHPLGIQQDVEISINGITVAKKEIVAQTAAQIDLIVPKDRYATVIQNAGSFVNNEWEAGDIGFLEVDQGQYEVQREVPAVCGVSLFIRADLFNSLKGFEPRTFAYYEDTDLSLRARLLGWKCVYCPKSILRHVHCGSGTENSNYFRRNVVYSRLFLASKMMEPKSWKDLIRNYRSNSREEFSRYRVDREIDDKPFLNAMKKYLKYRIIFIRNRIFERVNQPSIKLASILSEKPKT